MDWDKIKQEYESTNISLSDLANKYGLKYPTVKSRKQREGWEKDASKGASKRKKDASKNGKYASGKKIKKRDTAVELVKNNREIEFEESPDLTERQRLFCLYFVKYWNATKAYQKAYGCSYNTANVEGSKSLVKPSLKKQIERLKKNIREGIGLEAMAVLQKYIDIAFADITDFVEFGREEVPVMAMFGPVIDKETKKPLTKMINTVKFKQSTDVDGTIISEVSQGKDGIKIKLSDKMKALEKLEKYLDLLPDHHKRRMEEEKLKIEQQRIELEKIKAGPKDENTEEWISALQEVAAKRRAKVTANE